MVPKAEENENKGLNRTMTTAFFFFTLSNTELEVATDTSLPTSITFITAPSHKKEIIKRPLGGSVS